MKKYIGCDMHKKFSVFVAMDERGRLDPAVKVSNDLVELRAYLKQLPAEALVAIEASGGWYWFVYELEAAGLEVRLVNPLEAKKRMAGRNKTDELDSTGPELRDLRGLLRTGLSLRCHTTILKNRIHAAIRRYGQYEPGEAKDLFRGKGRVQLSVYIGALPQETRLATRHEWELVDDVEAHIQQLEMRIRLGIGQLGLVRLLKTLPGVGDILSATIYLELGAVSGFPSAEHLASYAAAKPRLGQYAGTVAWPRGKASVRAICRSSGLAQGSRRRCMPVAANSAWEEPRRLLITI